MRSRHLTCLSVLSAALVMAAPTTGAQTLSTSQTNWTPPRTAWGDPDLQGVWIYATMTPLERPQELAEKEVLSPEEAAEYERQTLARQRAGIQTAGPDWWDSVHLANRRTSLIVDPANGKIPPLTPEAQQREAALARARRERGALDWIDDLSLSVRCLLWPQAGPPMLPGNFNNNVQLFQTRQYVAIVNEMIHDARIVPIDGRSHGSIRQWMGDSRGHWEGATLVVDTVSFSEKTRFRGSDDHLHVIERFTRVSPDAIEYRFTIEDPTVWTRPWTATFPLRRTEAQLFEYACHEGNARSIEGMFSGARAEENRPRR